MQKLAISPNPFVQMFNDLCLNQVKEQLFENLVYRNPNPPGFMLDGDLFVVAHNRTFIVDESLLAYGIKLDLDHNLN